MLGRDLDALDLNLPARAVLPETRSYPNGMNVVEQMSNAPLLCSPVSRRGRMRSMTTTRRAVWGRHPRTFARIGATATVIACLTMPACGGCGDDGPGVDNMVASAERWLRVAAPAMLPDGDGTLEADLEVIEVREDRSEGPRHREVIAVHSWFASGIEEAFAGGDSVYLALSSAGAGRETVSYVIARDPDGRHRFVGRCMGEGQALLKDRLGTEFDARMEEVIGSTDSEAILGLLGAS